MHSAFLRIVVSKPRPQNNRIISSQPVFVDNIPPVSFFVWFNLIFTEFSRIVVSPKIQKSGIGHRNGAQQSKPKMRRAQQEQSEGGDCQHLGNSRNESSTSSRTSSRDPHNTGPIKGDTLYRPRWTSLLAFSSRPQTYLLCISFASAISAGAAGPIYNIFFGKVLDLFTEFAGDQLDPSGFKRRVAFDSAIIAGIGVGNWILNALFLGLWMSLGQYQARTCYNRIFDRLLDKPISWYDTRQSGISALMPKIHSYGQLSPNSVHC